MKTIFAMTMLLSLSAFAHSECPNLTGTYAQPPTQYSSMSNGYQISQAESAEGFMTYHIVSIDIDSSSGKIVDEMPADYTADGIRHDSPNEVIPGASIKTYCSDGKLVYETRGFFVISSDKKFSLDEQGNLVLGNQTFPRIK